MKKTEHKILAGSLLAAALTWVADAAIDAFIFGRDTFLDSLFKLNGHELYFRSFFMVAFLFFGIVVSGMFRKRSEAEENLKRLFAAMESSMDGIAIYNPDDEYVYVNQSYSVINGYETPQNILGKTCRQMYGDQEHDRMKEMVIPLLERNARWRGELVGRRKNGRNYYQEASITLLDDGGRVCIVRDITWRKRSEERLQRSERFLNTIFNSIRDPFCIFDNEFRIIRVNDAYAQIKKKELSQLIGKKCYEALMDRNTVCESCVVEKTFNSGDPCAKDKQIAFEKEGETWVEIYTYPILDEQRNVTHVIEYTRDITDRKKSEEEKRRLIDRLEYLSRTDALTGLINRRALTDNLNYEIDRAKRYSADLALILCDIDNFKEINDTFGHDMGDRALQTLSASLKTMLRKTDIAGRYGGDEFMLILPETALDGAERLADKILEEVRNAVLTFRDGRQVGMSLSIGVSCLSGEKDDLDSLVKRADDAMYRSKTGGRDRFTSSTI